MEPMYYIGLDVHKQKTSYCVKDLGGKVCAEGSIPATRFDLDHWMKTLPLPWSAAMEATMFTGWIYDHLKPHAAALKVAHPLMLRAIAAAKKKNDRIDANTERHAKSGVMQPASPVRPSIPDNQKCVDSQRAYFCATQALCVACGQFFIEKGCRSSRAAETTSVPMLSTDIL
jgi:hypothetical protein